MSKIKFYDRKYEIELLKRKFDHNLEYDIDRLYHKDIKEAWLAPGYVDVSEDIQHEIMLSPIDLMLLQDNEIKRKVTEYHNKRILYSFGQKATTSDNYKSVMDAYEAIKIASDNEIVKVDVSKSVKTIIDEQLQIADGLAESALLTGTVFDKFDGGFRNEYILIAARPSVGKSISGLQIAINLCEQGKKVAFFSFEMSEKALLTRMLYHVANVSANNAKQRILTAEQRSKLIEAQEKIDKFNLTIFDTPSDIKVINQECKKGNYDIVVIDYLQKIRPHRNADRRIIIEEISSALQDLPKIIKAPVICISSLSRPDGKDENKPPNMMELKETSNLEFDADVIILMHRRKENGVYDRQCDLMCTKNRNGQTGYLKAEVYGSVYKIK